ncbi:MAG: hypothetical protein JOZ90_11015 [Alphaproteobacteria bacterium]|nr:hypothetical protein [Alphaproteobacteria bacterium]MBV9371011.1 hypothetical protein [Alphaproteobacteria bacterium]MBV9901616.1 hypothetical protein [Alphaproteobacteria bacterium]
MLGHARSHGGGSSDLGAQGGKVRRAAPRDGALQMGQTGALRLGVGAGGACLRKLGERFLEVGFGGENAGQKLGAIGGDGG